MSTHPSSPHSHSSNSANVFEARSYIQRVRSGVTWLKSAWAITIGVALMMVAIMLLPLAGVRIEGDTLQVLMFVFAALGPLIAITTLVGTFLYTTRDPRLSEQQSASSSRMILRSFVTLSTLGAITVVALILARGRTIFDLRHAGRS